MKTLLASMAGIVVCGAAALGANDVFEKIAGQKNEAVPGLAANPAPKLPDVALPWDAQPSAGFQPGEKMETQAQLDAELKRMQKKYTPFLADLAPVIPSTREKLELEKFDWRLATETDSNSLADVFDGKGNWKTASIPHYTGPINRATAFYRTEVVLDDSMLKPDSLFLHFQGVDYLANIFMNGRHVSSHEGLFAPFEFDIKPFVKRGKNVLMVEVKNDAVMMGDFMNPGAGRQFGKKIAACGGPDWDEPGKGWHMCPPGFGIWRQVWLETRSAAFVRDIFVRPLPQKNEAEVLVEIVEAVTNARPVTLAYSLYGQNFQATLVENQLVSVTPQPAEDGARLCKFTVPIPKSGLRWWSPNEPWLYQIQVQLKQDGKVIDAAKRQFGMRTFVQSATSTPKGRFYLNGKEIRLRGANMMGNLMQDVMRGNSNQLRDDILLAKISHLNFWRMTQQPCQEEVYDYFDRLGLLAQTDLPVFNGIRTDQTEAAFLQLQEMVRLVRKHPCNAVITYCNEPDFKKPMMLDRQGHAELFHRFDAAALKLNPDQVIKWIEGDYVNISENYSDHHDYGGWYGSLKSVYQGAWHATREGWMHGCGEFGAEALDSVALMKKYYPPEWLKTAPDGSWNPRVIPKSQTATTGLKWFPAQKTMEDWVAVSREHQKWVVRLMTESFRRDPKMNSFAVHLLIDAWPAGWMKAIMDCDRQAKPAYFTYRDVLTPLAVSLQPEKFYCFSGSNVSVRAWVCNDTQEIPAGAQLRYQLEMDGKIIKTGSAPAVIKACEPQFQGNLDFVVPDVAVRQPLTLRLGLFSRDGKLLHDSSADLDVFPAPAKGKKPDRSNGLKPDEILI
jgi:hypothetical protein